MYITKQLQLLTCAAVHNCSITIPSIIGSHRRDRVHCVTGQSSEGVVVHWLSIIRYDHRTPTVIDSKCVVDRSTAHSGRGPGQYQ